MPHVIRLRGAWETSSLGDRTHHSRKFGRPRTLDVDERVWLVCDRVPAPVEVSLNGQLLISVGDRGPFSADVTDLLQPRNAVLFVVLSLDPLGEVALEIRTRDSLLTPDCKS